jgi:2-hydroxy-3-keto-5-methylthiopentenyl-1-phosphate phosphatase
MGALPSPRLAAVLPIGSVLVDFDGTACLHDVAEHLLMEFGDESWQEWDRAWERGEIGSHAVILAQAAMLREPTSRLLAFALRHCPIDPTFPTFVRWLESREISVTIVSDGFGFYIEPLLRTVGLARLPVITNSWNGEGAAPVRFENGHPKCVGCGTCKMNAVLNARGRGAVAYVGEGGSDRFGAIYSDVVFAKDALVDIARRDGVPFLGWETFDDVRHQLEHLDGLPGPVGAERCPGWRTA